MSPQEHAYQRDLVTRSLLLADTPEERHGTYAHRPLKRRTSLARHPIARPIAPASHAFAIPVVTERPL